MNQAVTYKHRLAAALFTITLLASGCGHVPTQVPTATPPKDRSEAPTIAESGKAGQATAEESPHRLYPGTGLMIKAPEMTPVTIKGGELSLSFEGADLREVVKTVLADILKTSYIIDPRVGGTVSLHTTRPIPRAAVLPTLENVLRMNGAVLIAQEDGVYHVVPSNLAGKGNLTPMLGQLGKPLPGGYSIQVVPLKFIGAPEMIKILEPMLPDPGAARPDLLRNLLFLSGTEPELRHMLETIDMFDVDWLAGMSVGLFTLKNVEVKTVVSDFEKLFGDKAASPFAGLLRIIPIERLNAILMVTPQAKYLDEASLWINRLDSSGGTSGGLRLFVYPVQNGKAETLAVLLNDAFGKKAQQKTASPSIAPGLKPAEVATKTDAKSEAGTVKSPQSGEGGYSVSQDIRVIADKENNALLIMASATDYESIVAALRKLDVVPRQVLIEVTIAEITLKDELKYGLEWFFSGSNVSGKLDTGASGIAQLVPGLSAIFTGKAGDIKGALNALATDSKLKVLSSPRITVADNQTAKIQVGDRVPTINQTQTVANTTTGVISTVQYVETGVMLTVTPRINAGGLVGLEINQEVSNAASTTTSGIDSPTIQKRAAQSTVAVQSGETLILAGLIKEEKTTSTSGVPGLSEMPLLGALFGTKSDSDNRTELVILITPHVLETPKQATEITRAYRKEMVELEKMIKEARIEPKNRTDMMWRPLDAPVPEAGVEPTLK